MAITIIKAGVLPESRLHNCTCQNCGCEFTFTAADATYHHDQRDGDFYTVVCPHCARPVHKDAK